MDFVGRKDDLARLDVHLQAVRETGTGRLVSVRGRRQVGKSRLVTELVSHAGLPSFWHSASRQATVTEDLSRFSADARTDSDLPDRDLVADVAFSAWEPALRALATALPDTPTIVVIDELPWLWERDPGFDGALQKVWDRLLERRPVLMIVIGSDIAMMSRLGEHDRPLYGRMREVVVEPFTVADTGLAIGEDDPAEAFDATLVTGGYPRLLQEWRRHGDRGAFLRAQLADENSDLCVIGGRVLDAELPADVPARAVLTAIGGRGERTFTAVGSASGVSAASLSRALQVLQDAKRLVAVDRPLSAVVSRETRYRVADPYLRFWLRFVEPALPDIGRGRADLALARLDAGWSSWRGRAIEPLVREALHRLAADDPRLGGAAAIGGWWPRTNRPEVDLVGVDRLPSGRVTVVGSVKWREREPFGSRDLAALTRDAAAVPGGADAPLLAVSRAGGAPGETGAVPVLTPADLLRAWA